MFPARLEAWRENRSVPNCFSGPRSRNLRGGCVSSRKAPAREVRRAEIPWRYHGGETIAEMMGAVKMTRKSVGQWIERALAMGVQAAPPRPGMHRTAQGSGPILPGPLHDPKDLG